MKGSATARATSTRTTIPTRVVAQDYLPDALRGRRYYEPTDRGHEREIGERLLAWRKLRGD